ncbi:Tuberous sclerosis 1 protein [Tolypocladium ophioglossoides CBS 100239]|uniref:Tuberous sclerosis 1 protein n=1 Tax=Tolypocladium ophioglossoides (strain CBS 100239) TaxID=1163406 RepID=A0A0L0N1K7_TOLOC|nr:Tuberous sclerosis 1 protein [Tolypocladium ophioglossoides CBS 100239]
MASSASLKELSRAIHAFILQPTLPLPDHLVDTIAAYRRRHEKYDDAASDRLQEELLGTFEKHVKGNPAASGPWVGLLRRLLPVLKTPERVLPWFDACKGLLDRTGLDKLVIDETVTALMDLVTLMDEYHITSGGDWATNPIIDRLFSIWMNRFYPALVEGNNGHEYNEGMEFFTSIDGCFVKKQYRKATLRFLCDFVQDQPPHLHQILQTSIFSNLLTCLQHDTSTTVISSALTALIMLLPHMPSSLVPHLPTLFNIYARLLFWDREKSGAVEASPSDPDQSRGWETCNYDPEVDDFVIAQLSNYYTILYGLYPINFMDYIRKPQRYLRHANMSNPDEIEAQPTEIRHRSERFRRCHLLHPNFYTLTIDSEKTDFGRWIKSEAAEAVVECMSLCRPADFHDSADQDAPPPMPCSAPTVVHDGSDKDRSDSALLSGSVGRMENWRNSQITSTDSESSNRTPSMMLRRISQSSQPSSRYIGEETQARGPSTDSPTIPAQLTLSPSHSQLQDMIYSNKVIKSGLHQSLANDSVPSLSLSHQESAADRPVAASSAVAVPLSSVTSPLSGMDLSTQVTRLQRRVLVLENDLSFERYVKQQHMGHIGELRRRLVVDAATEAETQNLIMMNRNLKSRFEEAKKDEMRVRKESEKSRALAKKWESDLASKLKNLRDESKRAAAELGALRRELDESKQECEKLRKLVCDTEVKELHWKQKMQSIEVQEDEIDGLRAQVEELSKSERDHQARELERQAAASSATEAEAQVEMMRMRLAAREHDTRRARDLFEGQVKELQRQLAEVREERERPGANSNLVIESALAASRAKQAELQKQYNLLMRKYTALQSSLLDMQAEVVTEPRQAQEWHAPGGEYLSASASPVIIKDRPHLSASNSEATAYNVTAPLGSPYSGTPTSAELERRATASQGGDDSGTGPLSISPGDQRHFGSSFQSRIRKEGRDKSKEDGGSGSGKPKKEKKKSGLRGIRGFV